MDKEIEMIVYKLESVGSGIDRYGWTYAGLVDGGYDMDSRVHLDDIEQDDDWFNGLSDKDRRIVLAIATQRWSFLKSSRRAMREGLYSLDQNRDLHDMVDPFTGAVV